MSDGKNDENEDEWEYVTEDEKKGASDDEKDKKKKINHFNEGLKKWKESKVRAANDGNVWDSWGQKESPGTFESYKISDSHNSRTSRDAERPKGEWDQDQVKGNEKRNKKRKAYKGKERLDADYGGAWRNEISEDRWYPENGGMYRANG